MIVYISIVIAVVVGAFLILRPTPTKAPEATTDFLLTEELVTYFSEELENPIIEEVGQPIEGFTPTMISSRYPGLRLEDFNGAEAVQGIYEYANGTLEFVFTADTPPHSAADALTLVGMKTFLSNLAERNEVIVDSRSEIDDLIEVLK